MSGYSTSQPLLLAFRCALLKFKINRSYFITKILVCAKSMHLWCCNYMTAWDILPVDLKLEYMIELVVMDSIWINLKLSTRVFTGALYLNILAVFGAVDYPVAPRAFGHLLETKFKPESAVTLAEWKEIVCFLERYVFMNYIIFHITSLFQTCTLLQYSTHLVVIFINSHKLKHCPVLSWLPFGRII